jgi:multiple sugar transport system permease protein
MKEKADFVNPARNMRNKQADLWSTVFISILAFLWLLPIYWMFAASFMRDSSILSVPTPIFPSEFYLGNYTELFIRNPALRWFYNSIFSSFMGAFLVVLISAMAGYSFAKKRFFASRFLFYIMVFTMIIPRNIMIVPLFKIIHSLNLFNSMWGLILPNLGATFGVFMMRQFMSTIPNELIEAATIDGASELRIFFRLMLPLTKPAIAALAIFTFITIWNDYLWHLLVISSKDLRTLPLGIATLQEENLQRAGLVIAGAVIASLPMIVIFFMFEKSFTKGITAGSVKG